MKVTYNMLQGEVLEFGVDFSCHTFRP